MTFLNIFLTILFCGALLIDPESAKSQTVTPTPGIPQTVEQGYETLVPESVQAARKNQEFAGQLQNLQGQLKQIQRTIPDKKAVEDLTRQVKQILQNDAVLRQTVVSLQAELKKIETLLDSYGQGYEAAEAAALAYHQRQQQKKSIIQPQSTDPLNP